MAEWNGLGRYPEDADVNDRPEEGTLSPMGREAIRMH